MSDCRPGIKSGWYVLGRCSVGFPVAGEGLNWVGMYRVVGQISGCGQGVELGRYVPGCGLVGFPVLAGRGSNWVGAYLVEVSNCRLVGGCKCW